MTNDITNGHRVLSQEELEQVSGAWLPNVFGAFAGAIGGVYGTAIGNGGSSSSQSLWAAGIAGATTGFLNPVSGVSRLVGTIGLGVVGGAVTNAVNSQFTNPEESDE
jgi:outer membrane lipoprotein SlyB